jgi:CBS domain-containing protein
VQTRDVMTRDVVTVGPDTSAKYAGELMAERGFAALPVVDGDNRLIGIVGEVDILRDRIPADPLLHPRRDPDPGDVLLPLLVRGVMTTDVRSASPSDDVATLTQLLVDGRLGSVPVLEDGVLVGIVSRRDVLRTLVRLDYLIRADILRVVEAYTGDPDCWDVQVSEGIASVRRTHGAPQVSRAVEEFALERLLRTVPGVVATHVLTDPTTASPHADASMLRGIEEREIVDGRASLGLAERT